MELTSQKMRKSAPELDPLRIGTLWKDLSGRFQSGLILVSYLIVSAIK